MKRKLVYITACFFTVLVVFYAVFAFSENVFISQLRNTYIQTAMGTMRHQWMATALLPSSAIDEAMAKNTQAKTDQIGIRSAWKIDRLPEQVEVLNRDSFLSLFSELAPASVDLWLESHPDKLQYGWNNLKIEPDESNGLMTIFGDPVLAVDVPNRILLFQVKTTRSKGVLAVAKDPVGLSLRPSSQLGINGETVGQIAEENKGILAVTGSAFHGANESGNGGTLAGYAMCSGVEFGTEHLPAGNKRVELHDDNLLYITDTTDPVSATCTDAIEFRPALIVDGQTIVGHGWAGLQPRVCLGQTVRGEVLMLVLEGRILSEGILGASVQECAQLLKRYGCMQAINLDGGNSAMLWYDGVYMTRCCDPTHPEGRPVPTAVVWSPPQ